MQKQERLARLLEKANSLPLVPGVYIMKNTSGKVIYVGKSRKLKNRVSQYFQNGEKNVKTARMVSCVDNFDYIVCSFEKFLNFLLTQIHNINNTNKKIK